MQSNKGQIIRKKMKKYESKYKMFHELVPSTPRLSGKVVMDSITKLTNYLDSYGFVPKLVVAADYMTTLYQLLHLREKYSGEEFMKISKIDLIMQGNPYSTS